MKLITFYLPQYHEIPENNKWWGKGFTEWVNVKKAKSLFAGHYQPREPYKDNYYDLLDDSVMEWQTELAKKYGIYGFCFYHYWFDGKKVLEKPIENLLNNPKANLPFCLCWANESWTKTWHGAGGSKEVLIRQRYGGEKEWTEHFEYLLQFFKDSRYIKEDNKPVVLIYRTGYMNKCEEMLKLWNNLAIDNGFNGIFIVNMLSAMDRCAKNKYISASVDFEPGRTRRENGMGQGLVRDFKEKYADKLKKLRVFNRLLCTVLDYDKINQEMLGKRHKKNEFRGVFVDYDDTPRRGVKGLVVQGSTPKKFEKYLRANIEKSIDEGNEYLFINAWNEWGESNYLEPDKRYGYSYLRAVREAYNSFDHSDKKHNL